jgi:hypothetical protein
LAALYSAIACLSQRCFIPSLSDRIRPANRFGALDRAARRRTGLSVDPVEPDVAPIGGVRPHCEIPPLESLEHVVDLRRLKSSFLGVKHPLSNRVLNRWFGRPAMAAPSTSSIIVCFQGVARCVCARDAFASIPRRARLLSHRKRRSLILSTVRSAVDRRRHPEQPAQRGARDHHDNDAVFALDARTGKLKWTFHALTPEAAQHSGRRTSGLRCRSTPKRGSSTYP